MTGFSVDLGEERHLIFFREATDEKLATYTLPSKIASAELLAANTTAETSVNESTISVKLGKKRSYAWIKVTLK